jgi:hypothetical protein
MFIMNFTYTTLFVQAMPASKRHSEHPWSQCSNGKHVLDDGEEGVVALCEHTAHCACFLALMHIDRAVKHHSIFLFLEPSPPDHLLNRRGVTIGGNA